MSTDVLKTKCLQAYCKISVFRNIKNFFQGLRFSKYKKLFQGFHFLKYNKFSQGGVLFFLGLGLKIAEFRFRKQKKGFLMTKYKRNFLLRNYEEFFLIFRQECFISENVRNFFRVDFFQISWVWDQKCARWLYYILLTNLTKISDSCPCQ